MSASRGADGLSGQIRARGQPRIYTYTPFATHTRVGLRERERDRRHTHTTSSTNPRRGNFCCATERPSRNLAYARLAAQPRPCLPLVVPFTVVVVVVVPCCAAPHRTVTQRNRTEQSGERDAHPTPAERTRSLAPSFNRTNHRTDDGRAKPSPIRTSSALGQPPTTSRESANFYHHRHLETRRDAP